MPPNMITRPLDGIVDKGMAELAKGNAPSGLRSVQVLAAGS